MVITMTEGDEGIMLRFPFHKRVNAAILAFPEDCRFWDDKSECWVVDESIWGRLRQILESMPGISLKLPKVVEVTEAARRIQSITNIPARFEVPSEEEILKRIFSTYEPGEH